MSPDASRTESNTRNHETVRILSRWVRELRRDLRCAQYRISQLELRLQIEERMPLDDIYSYWLEQHQPAQLVELAAELEGV